jgi:hypothetical protein
LEYNKLFNKGLGDLICLNSPKALPCTTPTQWEYKVCELVEGEALTAAGTEEWGRRRTYGRGRVVGAWPRGEGREQVKGQEAEPGG